MAGVQAFIVALHRQPTAYKTVVPQQLQEMNLRFNCDFFDNN